MSLTTNSGKRHKLQDLICWNHLEGRRCVRHAELAIARGIQAVIVPLPIKNSNKADTQQQQGAAAAPAAAGSRTRDAILKYAESLHQQLSRKVTCILDADLSIKPGEKYHKWERLGVPLRLEAGEAEVKSDTVTIVINPGVVAAIQRAAASSSSSSSSISTVEEILQEYAKDHTALCIDSDSPAAAAADPTAAVAAAVLTAGTMPLKLSGVPAASFTKLCCKLLMAAVTAALTSSTKQQQQQQQSQQATDCSSLPPLLPYGSCRKLHLWPEAGSSSSSTRPCVAHIKHLIGLSKPCFCGAAPHVTWESLKSEITRQITATAAVDLPVKIAAAAAAAAANRQGQGTAAANGSSTSNTAVGIFVSNIPVHIPAAAVRQQLSAEFERFGTVTNVTVPAVGRSPRGWARVMMQDVTSAEGAIQQLQGKLVLQGHHDQQQQQQPLMLSYCCGRNDALFPNLPYEVRRQLRIDSVAAYSTTDSDTAAAMSSLLAAVAAAVRGWQQQQQQQRAGPVTEGGSSSSDSGLSVTDLTACAGGNVMSFMLHFDYVTAVEIDPDRAEDLLHNIQIVTQQQQQRQQQRGAGREGSNPTHTAPAAFDPQAVPHLAILQSCQQQQQQQQRLQKQGLVHQQQHHSQQQQQQQCKRVAVICGDAVLLLPHLQNQDVIFLDPPWGGPSYKQQQQQQQQRGELPGSSDDSRPDAPDIGPAAADGGSSINSSSSSRTNGLCLGSMPLADLCSQFVQKCNVLAVKLPSRGSDVDAFCQLVLCNAPCTTQQQWQQQQQDAVDGEVPRGPMAAYCSIRARYGRSKLVIFVRCPAGSPGTLTQSQQCQGQQETVLHQTQLQLEKQLRQILAQQQQHLAKIMHGR